MLSYKIIRFFFSDSSLLLSPKADIPMTGDNTDIQSQEVPNFLSGIYSFNKLKHFVLNYLNCWLQVKIIVIGFRKTGLSFFGGSSALSSEPKPESSAPNDGNGFSFNFGGEKKNRGGLFSLFN